MSETAAETVAWQCRVCAAENSTAGASAKHCWACGRPRPRIDLPRRLRRIGAIVFGVALQIGAGVLIWLFPPGVSVWSWVIYLLMGIVGFLHIFIGGEMLRRDLKSNHVENEELRFTAALLPHPTGEPATLGPNEMRMNGAVLVAALVVLALGSSIVLWLLGGP